MSDMKRSCFWGSPREQKSPRTSLSARPNCELEMHSLADFVSRIPLDQESLDLLDMGNCNVTSTQSDEPVGITTPTGSEAGDDESLSTQGCPVGYHREGVDADHDLVLQVGPGKL